MRAYKFKLFADYFQFYLQDEQAEGIQGESWTKEASDRMLALAPGAIGVGTARNMYVPVTLEVQDAMSTDDIDSWDQVLECSIEDGEVHGDLTATEKIELYPPAKIYGNIRTPSLVVEEGVIFEGTCSMASVKAETLSLSEPEQEHAGDEEPLEAISAQAWPPSDEESDSLTEEVPDKTALHKHDR